MNVINILKLRGEEIKAQEITTVRYAIIYAVGKRKPALHRSFFPILSLTLLLQSHFIF